jgi:AbiV family abortive infection protein
MLMGVQTPSSWPRSRPRLAAPKTLGGAVVPALVSGRQVEALGQGEEPEAPGEGACYGGVLLKRVDASSAGTKVASAKELLANAERLISDAEHLHAQGRCRSAATLVVVALEQMGAFVEALTLEKYPSAQLHMGIFGDKANSHARRQDALAGHVFGFAHSQFTIRAMVETYVSQTGATNEGGFLPWLLQPVTRTLTLEQQEAQRQCPDIATANLLIGLTRANVLKELREYGLYENSSRKFSDSEIKRAIELAQDVRAILAKSDVVPEPVQLVGVNMPEGLVLDPVTRKLRPMNEEEARRLDQGSGNE